MPPSHANTSLLRLFIAGALALLLATTSRGHIVPPEKFDSPVEGYRRLLFVLNLNPVLWDLVKSDTDLIAARLDAIAPAKAAEFRAKIAAAIAHPTSADSAGELPGPNARIDSARLIYEESTRAIAHLMMAELDQISGAVTHNAAESHLGQTRKYWAAFEHEVKASDPTMHREMGKCFLGIATGIGNAELMGHGARPMDSTVVRKEAGEIRAYVAMCYGDFYAAKNSRFEPLPCASKTCDPNAKVPVKLPPGSNTNKQRPRPRQVLNFASRGVSETETPLVAYGDMAFDSPRIFGERAMSLGISCNSCHNKSITNPNLTIPGLTSIAGGIDVSNNFFAPHANNGHFDPLDVPDLRGIRFTAPYGRNGRFTSLREFTRNVIVNEFDGVEPDPIMLDALVAYMNEFDFLPNPLLQPDGRLSAAASESAHRGEAIFTRPFPQMANRSCATCHVPSSNFTDGLRHDIGSVHGTEPHSKDRTLDTPTLLSANFSQPYFHDGRHATLGDVVTWFDDQYALGLSESDEADLTAYLEAVGDGTDAYETDPDLASPGEVEEQYFFMASWEFIRDKRKPELADLLFRTVATELRNEKWGLRFPQATEVTEQLAVIADACAAANASGDLARVNEHVAEYRKLYESNAELIAGEVTPMDIAGL